MLWVQLGSSMDNNRRKYIRALPDDNEYVEVDMAVEGEFTFRFPALIIEVSPMGGCSITCLQRFGLKKGMVCRMKLGQMAPLKSEIVWERDLDEEVSRYGIKFLE